MKHEHHIFKVLQFYFHPNYSNHCIIWLLM